MKKILVVCTGNTCRSPFAAGYFNKKFAECKINAVADSAGLFAFAPQKPCDNALLAAKSLGVDLSEHMSRNITSEDILNSDYVFAVSDNHYQMLLPKVSRLNDERKDGKNTELFVLGNGIDDPFGGSFETYKKCYQLIAECVDCIVAEMLKQ